ncbi:hypothetical protein VTL71DRAFT_3723 [Oculimacula yallundae]|uniref:Uncharacterized protein n=1 Tax=Oculimacula yallundae TaxID=86028 RepID=A0ABR4C3S4_9HELO
MNSHISTFEMGGSGAPSNNHVEVKPQTERLGQSTTRRRKDNVAKDMAFKLVGIYGSQAYSLDIEAIIAHLAGPSENSSFRGPPESCPYSGTTAHQVSKQLGRLKDKAANEARGMIYPTPQGPRQVRNAQPYSNTNPPNAPRHQFQQVGLKANLGTQGAVSNKESSPESHMKDLMELASVEQEGGLKGVSDDESEAGSAGGGDMAEVVKEIEDIQKSEQNIVLREQLNSLRKDLTKAEDSNSSLQRTIDNADEKIQDLEDRLASADNERQAAIEEKLAAIEEKNAAIGEKAQLENTCKLQIENINSLTKQVAGANAKASRSQELLITLKKSENRLKPFEKKFGDEQEKNARLKALVDVNESKYKAALDAITKSRDDEVGEMKKKISSSQKKFTDLQILISSKDSQYTADMTSLATKNDSNIREIKKALGDLESETNKLQDIINSNESKHAEELVSINAENNAKVQDLEDKLDQSEKKAEELQELLTSYESTNKELESTNTKSVVKLQNLEKKLEDANASLAKYGARLDELEKAKKDKEADHQAPKPKISKVWSSRFFSVKAFQLSGLAVLLFTMLFLANNPFSRPSNDENTNLSIVNITSPFVYVIPTATGLEDPTLTSILTEETTCAIEEGYFGNLELTTTDTIDNSSTEGQDTEKADGKSEEVTVKSMTGTKKVVLCAIPVTVVVVGAWYFGWV